MDKKNSYEEQKQYYDTEWADWLNRKRCEDEICRKEFIVLTLEKLKFRFEHRPKIIDLGCGPGWIADTLFDYGDVVGVDMSISIAKKLYPNLKFIQANIVKDKIEGKYDIVVSSEVIEHFTYEDQQIYVKKAYDLLNKGGTLILTTPNKPKTEKLVKELSISRDQLQPIENWLDKKSLLSLLYPYFEIRFVGTTMFHLIFIRKHKYISFMHNFPHTRLKIYKLVNRLLRSTSHGLYLTVVASKRKEEGEFF